MDKGAGWFDIENLSLTVQVYRRQVILYSGGECEHCQPAGVDILVFQ